MIIISSELGKIVVPLIGSLLMLLGIYGSFHAITPTDKHWVIGLIGGGLGIIILWLIYLWREFIQEWLKKGEKIWQAEKR